MTIFLLSILCVVYLPMLVTRPVALIATVGPIPFSAWIATRTGMERLTRAAALLFASATCLVGWYVGWAHGEPILVFTCFYVWPIAGSLACAGAITGVVGAVEAIVRTCRRLRAPDRA